jgi:4-amino-4-deoxy-L-arabinose transferase-like glycosyltransferase
MTRLRNGLSRNFHWFDIEHYGHIWLVGLLTISFTLRLAVALIIPIEYRFEADAVKYVADARNLINLGVFGEEPGIPYALVPPGYPLFIATIFAPTNQSMMAVRLAQAVLAITMVWLTFCVGQEVASKRVGLWAAFFIAVYPVWILWPVFFLTETLYTVLLLIFTWCLVRSMKIGSANYAILAGFTFGLALLTREVLFVFPFMLPLVLWWSRTSWWQAWRYLLVFALATLLTLSPWLARNYNTFGHVFYTERIEAYRYQFTGRGYLSPYYAYLADESIPPPPDKAPEYFERYGKSSDMFEVSRLLTEPSTYMRHLVNRVVELWLHPNGLASLPNLMFIRAAYICLHIAVLVLAGISIFAGLKRRDVATGILALILLQITITSLFFSNPHPRYTLPALPLVFILSAAGVNSILQRRGIGCDGQRGRLEASSTCHSA